MFVFLYDNFMMVAEATETCRWILAHYKTYYRGADKSLARPGRKQTGPVKSVMGRGMDWFG